MSAGANGVEWRCTSAGARDGPRARAGGDPGSGRLQAGAAQEPQAARRQAADPVEHRGRPGVHASLDRCIVSTDDEEIADVARSLGADVPFLRPAEYAQDNTPDLPVFQHALRWLAEHEGYRPAMVVHLRPTLPFREPRQIDDVIRLMRETGADCVKSVYREQHHPHKMWKLHDGRQRRLGPYEDTPLWRQARAGLPAPDPGAGLLVGRPRRLHPHRDRRARLDHRRGGGAVPRQRRPLRGPRHRPRFHHRRGGPGTAPAGGCAVSLTTIEIAGRLIGEGQPCYVIAEAGVNHNGDPALAKRLIDIAADAGADAVKFQKRTPSEILTAEAMRAAVQRPDLARGDLRRAPREAGAVGRELPDAARSRPDARHHPAGELPGTSRSVDFLDELGIPAYKIASADCSNLPLIEYTGQARASRSCSRPA